MKPPRKVERSDDQVQVSISLPRQLLEAIQEAADEHTRGNRSKLIAAALYGVIRTDQMAKMVEQGRAQPPLTNEEMLRAALHLIAKEDPGVAKQLTKLPIFKKAGA